MHCDEIFELMSAALDGEITPAERKEMDAHLADCPRCAELFAELAGQSALLRRLDCQVPAGLSNQILAQLPSRKKASPVVHLRRWGTLAACLVLVVAGSVALGNPLGANSAEKADSAAYVRAAEDAAVPAASALPETAMGAPAEANLESFSTTEETDFVPADGSMHQISPPEYGFEEPGAAIDLGVEIRGVHYLRTGWLDLGEVDPILITATEDLAPLKARYPALSETLAAYDDGFFRSASLIAVTVEEGSGSITHTVESILPAMGGWSINIAVHVPELGTCDMAGWLILIETAPVFSPGDVFTVNGTF